MKKSHVLRQLGLGSQAGIWVVTLMLMCLLTPLSAMSTDKLIVKNGDGETTLKIEDNGSISSAARLLANGASEWGSGLGQGRAKGSYL